MNLIMRVFGHYEPLETLNLIMIVSLIIRCIMRFLAFQCGASKLVDATEGTASGASPFEHLDSDEYADVGDRRRQYSRAG